MIAGLPNNSKECLCAQEPGGIFCFLLPVPVPSEKNPLLAPDPFVPEGFFIGRRRRNEEFTSEGKEKER